MGVDSGLPDFRGPAGLWNAYPGLKVKGLRFEQIANPLQFEKNPYLAWGFYGHRLKLYRETTPNPAFAFLLKILQRIDGFVFTSNVDGQFQKAGFSPNKIIEIHGSIHHLQCLRSCSSAIWSAEHLNPVIDSQSSLWIGELPKCPSCSGLARPNILLFGDWDYIEPDLPCDLTQQLAKVRRARFPVVVEIGAGESVPTVRRFSESLGIPLIRINPRDTHIPFGLDGVSLKMGAAEASMFLMDGIYAI